MAITRVEQPQRPQSGLGKLSQVASIAGPILTLFPPTAPIGAAVTAGGAIAGGLERQRQAPPAPQPQTIDTSAAVDRRKMMAQQQQDPGAMLAEATKALDELDLTPEQRDRFRRPLLLAQQKGGFA